MTNNNYLEKLKLALNEYKEKYGNDIFNKYFPKSTLVKETSISESYTEAVQFFIKRFFNRADVYAKFWKSAKGSGYSFSCKNEWIKNICRKANGGNCSKCNFKQYESINNQIVLDHINGKRTIGTYGIDEDNKSLFLVFDFDEENWKREIVTLKNIASKNNLHSYIEISKSGNGGHLWLFFNHKVDASILRSIGSYLLTQMIEECDIFEFSSFDRMFPNQNKILKDGLGNLICLPYAGMFSKTGSYFVDDNFNKIPLEEFIKNVKLNSSELNKEILNRYRIPSKNDINNLELKGNNKISIIRSNELIFKISQLDKSIKKYLRYISSFPNPEFKKRENQRLSTYNVPYIISTASIKSGNLHIPRGLEKEILDKFKECKIPYEISSSFNKSKKINIEDNIELRPNQEITFNNIIKNNTGILVAETGFGKTVIGCKLIAHYNVPTIILVNRNEIRNQWFNSIKKFTNIEDKDISIDRNNLKKVNILTVQALARCEDITNHTKTINMVIVDECHHIGALSYENICKDIKCKYIYGLSATPKRSDGLTPLLTYRIGSLVYATHEEHNVQKVLVIKETDFSIPTDKNLDIFTYNDYLIKDKVRNGLIANDIIEQLKSSNTILVIVERLIHLEELYSLLEDKNINLIKLHGKMNKRESITEKNKISINTKKVIIATGSYIGEGFDLPDIDTIFITFPFKWSEKLKQYVGRIRITNDKKVVTIVDYFDKNISFYFKMFTNRLNTYQKLGFSINENVGIKHVIFSKNKDKSLIQNEILNANTIWSSFDIALLEKKTNKYTYKRIDKGDIKWVILDEKIVWIFNSNDIILRLQNDYIIDEIRKYLK